MIRDLWLFRCSLLCFSFLVSTLVYSNPWAIQYPQPQLLDQQVSGPLSSYEQSSEDSLLKLPSVHHAVLRDGEQHPDILSVSESIREDEFSPEEDVDPSTKFWKDSVATLNREVYVREQTISYLKEELKKAQLASVHAPSVKDTVHIRDTVRVIIMDKHRNLVLSLENEALMDSILDVKERLDEREATIKELADKYFAYERVTSQPDLPKVIRDTFTQKLTDTVFVEIPKETIITQTDTVFVDVPKTEIVQRTDTVFVDVPKLKTLRLTDTVFVDVPRIETLRLTDTVFVDVPGTASSQQPDTVFVDVPTTETIRLTDTVFVDVPKLKTLRLTDTVFVQVHDTVFLDAPIPAYSQEQKGEFESRVEVFQDSIDYLRRISNRMETLLEERQGRVDFLRRQLAWVEAQPKIGFDTVYVDVHKQVLDTVFLADPDAMQELWSENKTLQDSLSFLADGLDEQKDQLSKTKKQLVESQKQILEINQQLMASLANSGINGQEAMLQDSLSRMQQSLAKYKQLIADRKDRILQLKSELEEQKKSPTIIRDTVERVVEANNYALKQQVETLTASVKKWKYQATESDSLLEDQTQHIGRLIQVINDVRMEEDSLIDLAKQWKSRYLALQQSQPEQSSSMEMSSAAKKFKQEFFEDRISNLKEAQHAVVQKEWKAESRLKRIQQRETFLSDWEKNPEQSQLFARIQELEDLLNISEESRITTIEMPIPPRNSIEIQPVYLYRGSTYIPAYSVKTPLEAKELSGLIRKWFKRRSLKVSQKGTLTYEQVVISELSPSPISVSFEISEQVDFNTVLVSAILRDGSSIGGETGDLADLRIRRFLYELFWFGQ
ncbi:MAG: hypothetical protein AAF587_11770 [Bacteroidota bacterium]